MRVMITGWRDFNDRELMRYVLSQLPKDAVIIEGEARGADTIAREVAEELGLTVEKYPADWNKYGRSAGPIRNREMLDADIDMVLAFHYDFRASRGTADAVRESLRRGKVVGYYGGCSPDQL